MIKSRRSWAGLASALVGLACLVGLALRDTQAFSWLGVQAAQPSALALVVAPAVVRPLVKTVELVGLLRPERSVDIAAPFDGMVLRRPLAFGDAAAAGAPLLELSTDDIDAQIREAQAALYKAELAAADLRAWSSSPEVQRARRTMATAQASQLDGERKLAESRRLLDLGIVPRTEVEDLQSQQRMNITQTDTARDELATVLRRGDAVPRRVAELELENLRGKLRVLQADRAQVRLLMPMAGTVVPSPARTGGGTSSAGSGSGGGTSASLEPGSRVKRGDVLLRVLSGDGFALHAQADELDVMQIKTGQRATVRLAALPDRSLAARVQSITAPVLPDTLRPGEPIRYELRLLLDALPPQPPAASVILRPGMSGQASIEVYRNDSALLVPVDAVEKTDDGAAHVTVRDASGRLQRTPVRLGAVGPVEVEVFGALGPGAKVVRHGASVR